VLTNPTLIRADAEKALTTGQELDLLRAAYRRSPTAQMRNRLVLLLMLEEAFDEAEAVLTTGEPLDFRAEMVLTQVHLSAETLHANRLALLAAGRALELAQTNAERAAALAFRGKCETRLGLMEKARATLVDAIEYDPNNRDACKRIAAIALGADEPQLVISITDDLLERGANHARLFAAQTLAHARAGNIALARKQDGFDSFHRVEQLSPPPGWDSIQAFNAALYDELIAHPGIRYERYGSASALTWRIENPARSDTPLVKALLAQIISRLNERVAEVRESMDHPWAAAAPASAFVRNWCVITESDGFETWHVHQFGWLSGVYYVHIPESIATGTSRDGCLAFGLPEDLAGTAGSAAFGEHLVRPQAGMMLTFPSHCYHRTYPHGTGEKRICLAFDLRPD
jgi:uncharacterized protein (TIGR02466 family)